MALSNELAKLFAKTTNDKTTTKAETTVYGTIVENDGTKFVKLDGSEVLTPVKTTASIKNGDRVTVMLKNHTAMVTGNITTPSASSSDVDRLASKIDEFEIVVADVVTTEELQAEVARIDTVVADNVTIHEKLTAMEADIGEITAGEVTTEQLNAVKADVEKLSTDKLDAATAEINYAKITELDAAKADISELESDNVTIKKNLTAAEANISELEADNVTINEKLTAAEASIETLESDNVTINEKLTANEASIKSLEAEDVSINGKLTALEAEVETLEAEAITTEYLDAHYANIDFSNIGEAAMEKFYADSGLIKNVQIGDATITGELVGVTISGDLIKGNTIVAEKLVIKGEDGLYYKLNTDGITTEAEQTDYNSLNGSLIQAQSITATKISVDDLVAFDATIGGFNISETALYSGVKSSVLSPNTGIFMDKYGELNVGDGTNYMRYYAKDGKYLLEISADSILFGTNKRSIEDIEVTSTAEGAPAYITDGADANAIDISVDGEMSQTQYTGKNLLDLQRLSTYTQSGLTYTPVYTKDDSEVEYIEVSGTTTAASNFWINGGYNLTLPAGTYIISGMENVTGGTELGLQVYDGTTVYARNIAGQKSVTFTLSKETKVLVYLNANTSGITYSGRIYPMIRLASNTDATYEPYCGGIPSPNPDYTQAIKATGDCGWFDGELLNGAYAYATGVFGASSIYVCSKNMIPCKERDLVNLTVEVTGANIGLLFYDANKTFIEQVNANTTTLSKYAPANACYVVFNVGKSGITPSTIGHVCVTINGKYAAIIDSVGKNLIDLNGLWISLGNAGTTSVVGDTITVTGIWYAYHNIKVKPNTNYYINGVINSYTLRGYIAVYTTDHKTLIKSGTGTFNSGEYTELSILLYTSNSNESGTSVYSNIQLEEGTVATDYVPHQSHREYIPLDEPLRSIGEVKDQIVCQNGVYGEYRELYKDVLSASNGTWNSMSTTYSVNTKLYQCKTNLPLCKIDNIMSTHFSYIDYDTLWSTDKEGIGIKQSEGYIYIRLRLNKDRITTNLGDWFNENVPEIIYRLATPTFTPFEDQTPFYRIKTFNNVTHISASDNANVKVTYYRNTDDGHNLANIKFLGDVIVEGSITTDQLNTDEIFANDAFINAISTNSVVVGANTTATNALNAINGLEIGVRNILLDSGETISTTNYMIKEYSVSKEVATSTKYTVVIKANIPTTHYLDMYIGQTSYYCSRFTGTGQDTIYIKQLTSNSTTFTGQWVRFYNKLIDGSGNGGATGTIYWVCLYEDHVKPPMDWIAAPEDTEASIEELRSSSISSVDVMYALSTSATSAPTTGWSTTAPAWEEGKFMWQKTVTTFADGEQSTSNPTCITGAKGADGTSVTILGSYATEAALKAAHPTGTVGDGYMVDGYLYVWNGSAWENVGKIQGDKGETGATGVGVSAIVEEYYLSSSSTAQSGGSWSTTQPAWSSGKYIWTRSKITWTNNTTTTTTPILAQAINSANTTANTANTNASNAVSTANTANTNASNAVSTANTAKANAATAQSTANANASKIASWCSDNDVTYIDGGKIYTGSITSEQIDTEELFANIAHIGKLTIDENGILTSEFLHESVIEEGSLVDDYININYEYSAPSVNDYKVVSGKTTLGFEDMVFERTDGYIDPHLTIRASTYQFPVTSISGVTKYSANGITYDKTVYGYIEGLGGYSQDISQEIRFIDVIADTLTWARCEIDFHTTMVNNLEVKGDISGAIDVSTSSGHYLSKKVSSDVTGGSSTRTITIFVPTGKYYSSQVSSVTYYPFHTALLYLPHAPYQYSGSAVPYLISGLSKNSSGTFLLQINQFTMATNYASYIPSYTLNSVTESVDGLTISLTIPSRSSILSFSSDITIS